MKKYILALGLLIIAGIALAYFTIKQNMALDNDVYLETTESIRSLKLLDNNIDILLFRIRYENQNDHEEIDELTLNLSEEFDNLRFEALFEEIESSPMLNRTSLQFDQSLLEKREHIDSFLKHHKELVEANELFLSYSDEEAEINEVISRLFLKDAINAVDVAFYRFLENSNEENKALLNDANGAISTIIDSADESDQAIVFGYIKTLSDIVIASEETHQDFTDAINQDTSQAIIDFELAYAEFHTQTIKGSNLLKTALVVYGFILLLALIFFAYLLRQHYLHLEQEVADRTQEISDAYKELQESQEQLIQSEKMASLGAMVAGVAHEINTPLGYVNSNVDTIKLNMSDINELFGDIEKLYQEAKSPERNNSRLSTLLSSLLKSYKGLDAEEIFLESQQLLEDSHHGLGEISGLVMSLKDFSRLDRQATDEIDIHSCIENSIKIATNHIKENHVDVKREYAKLPKIICTPSKLNQLFLNIITNASQAMKEKGGELKITTLHKEENIIVSFTDQGVGMDEDTLHKMFDPFFTSKPIGEGTGLGMSIAYKIVEAHNGKIQAKSKPGVGTTVAIQLPLKG